MKYGVRLLGLAILMTSITAVFRPRRLQVARARNRFRLLPMTGKQALGAVTRTRGSWMSVRLAAASGAGITRTAFCNQLTGTWFGRALRPADSRR
jgi:hypothetical protein